MLFNYLFHIRACTHFNITHNMTCVSSNLQHANITQRKLCSMYLTVYDERAGRPLKRKPFALHLPLFQVNDGVALLLALGRLLSTHRL